MNQDLRGVPLSAGDTAALASYEKALTQLQSYVGDPIATLDAALAEAPDFTMGHVFKGLALFTQSEKALVPAVEAALADAKRGEARRAWKSSAGPRDSRTRAVGLRCEASAMSNDSSLVGVDSQFTKATSVAPSM
jgi:hypothetical protein